MLTKTMHPLRTYVFGAAIMLAGCSNSEPSQPSTVASPSAASSSPYENLLIRRPGSSLEDGKVYIVQNGKKHWVINASWFASHGHKFPDDVRQISATDVDAIPPGDPIQ